MLNFSYEISFFYEFNPAPSLTIHNFPSSVSSAIVIELLLIIFFFGENDHLEYNRILSLTSFIYHQNYHCAGIFAHRWMLLSRRKQEELKNNWLPVPDIYDKIIFQSHTSLFLLYFPSFFVLFALSSSWELVVFPFNCEQRETSLWEIFSIDRKWKKERSGCEKEEMEKKKNVNNWLQCGFHTQESQ